jgi:hypothetical protein
LSEEFESKVRAEAEQFQAKAGKQMEGVMVIIAIFGGLFVVGAVFAALRNISYSYERRHRNSHIV